MGYLAEVRSASIKIVTNGVQVIFQLLGAHNGLITNYQKKKVCEHIKKTFEEEQNVIKGEENCSFSYEI